MIAIASGNAKRNLPVVVTAFLSEPGSRGRRGGSPARCLNHGARPRSSRRASPSVVMRGRAHSRDEGGFGRVVAASAVLLALLSGIVVMMLGAVGHMARMTSPGLANLGSPAARERHPAERRNSAGGFAPLGSGRRVHRSGGTRDGNDAVGDGSLTLDELRESLGGDVTTDFSWSDGCLLYTSPSPRDGLLSRMPSSA